MKSSCVDCYTTEGKVNKFHFVGCRALEERRKNYEAEEERKRREILAQRRKDIQEATEKFQRSNIIKNKRKIKHTERTATPAKTGKFRLHENVLKPTTRLV